MAIHTYISELVPEKSSAKLTAKLQDEDGNGVGNPTTLILTLYVEGDLTSIINSRNGQNVLNVNNVTVDSSGNLTFLMQPADNQIINTNRKIERHVALFEWTWGSGKESRHEIIIPVENLQKPS